MQVFRRPWNCRVKSFAPCGHYYLRGQASCTFAEIQQNILKTTNDLGKLDKDCIHLEEILKKEDEKKKFFDDKLLQIKSNFKAKEEDLLKKKRDIEDFNNKNSELSKEHNLIIQENEELIISLKEKFKKINDELSEKKKKIMKNN